MYRFLIKVCHFGHTNLIRIAPVCTTHQFSFVSHKYNFIDNLIHIKLGDN